MKILDYQYQAYSNLNETSLAIAVSEYIYKFNKTHLIITENAYLNNELYKKLLFLIPKKKIFKFNELEILPFDSCSANKNIISSRLNFLYQIQSNSPSIILTTYNNILKLLPPKKFLNQLVFVLKKGDMFNLIKQKEMFVTQGYKEKFEVHEKGEFSIRGSIIDIFPMGSNNPFRIDLFDNEVDSIRIFNTVTQRSKKTVPSINILPTQEFILDEKSIKIFHQKFCSYFPSSYKEMSMYKSIINKESFDGIEFYIDLFHEKLDTLFDYISSESIIHDICNFNTIQNSYFENITSRHKVFMYSKSKPVLPLELVYLSPNNFNKLKATFKTITWTKERKDKSYKCHLNNFNKLIFDYNKNEHEKLITFVQENKYERIIFCTKNTNFKEFLEKQFIKNNISFLSSNTWEEIKSKSHKHNIILGPLSEGLIIDEKVVIITDNNFTSNTFSKNFNNYFKKKTSNPLNVKTFESTSVKNLGKLKINCLVVHMEKGIAKYEGLTTLNINSKKTEFLTLSFKNNEKLYVPVHDLMLIHLYKYNDRECDVELSTLGNNNWNKEKRKACQNIGDVAAKLLSIYSDRSIKKGLDNKFNKNEYFDFCANFPFKETPDQLSAENDVINDMLSKKPMDRLICGDVGFGKTEIAMRSAFIATNNNRQVILLTPTTLLAQQHYESFNIRFKKFNVNVEVLSRFKNGTEQKEIVENLKNGKIDIIVGTHKLLMNHMNLYDLGLLIIDEEHKFGVEQKEKIKSFNPSIDILALTATPIPRTLNLAFSKIRDLSIISTPPPKRLSVITFIKKYDLNIVNEAIMRETLRGGQVYYLYNEVINIEKKLEYLKKNFPNLKIAIAHGQLPKSKLEKTMADFQKNLYQILLCSTIIENGLDIPNANTIIIEKPEKFGLAQLHQLRGRVGRSFNQSYAYLLTSQYSNLSQTSKKRLNAISETNSIGGGYNISTHDLEIRGAGEILGKSQSGNMKKIGFSLYMELLDKTVEALKSGKTMDIKTINSFFEKDAKIELGLPYLLPEKYIFDTHTRLNFYQKISSAKSFVEVNNIKDEITDRFGKLPEEANYLFSTKKIEINARKIHVKSIKISSFQGEIEFCQPIRFNPKAIINLIASYTNILALNTQGLLVIKKQLPQNVDRIDFIINLMSDLDKEISLLNENQQ